MPQLPQVQTVRKFLQSVLITSKPLKIKSIKAFYPGIIKQPQPTVFINSLIGQTFKDIDRYGKFLILKLQNYSIISHLRMEGKYIWYDKKYRPEKHDHIQFLLSDGNSIVYNDVRKFGTMHLVKRGEQMKHPSLAKLGPQINDPNTCTEKYLIQVCAKSSKTIKELLLQQEIVCGIGNIYADQILFEAGVHPQTKSNKLTPYKVRAILKAGQQIIDRAILNKGTTFRSFSSNNEAGEYQNSLRVYGKDGDGCSRCGSVLKKIKVGGRGTHFCSHCQKMITVHIKRIRIINKVELQQNNYIQYKGTNYRRFLLIQIHTFSIDCFPIFHLVDRPQHYSPSLIKRCLIVFLKRQDQTKCLVKLADFLYFWIFQLFNEVYLNIQFNLLSLSCLRITSINWIQFQLPYLIYCSANSYRNFLPFNNEERIKHRNYRTILKISYIQEDQFIIIQFLAQWQCVILIWIHFVKRLILLIFVQLKDQQLNHKLMIRKAKETWFSLLLERNVFQMYIVSKLFYAFRFFINYQYSILINIILFMYLVQLLFFWKINFVFQLQTQNLAEPKKV